jgi:hypothetical protein
MPIYIFRFLIFLFISYLKPTSSVCNFALFDNFVE